MSELSLRGKGLTTISPDIIAEHASGCVKLDLTENTFKYVF